VKSGPRFVIVLKFTPARQRWQMRPVSAGTVVATEIDLRQCARPSLKLSTHTRCSGTRLGRLVWGAG
jgi:hypothetical protein